MAKSSDVLVNALFEPRDSSVRLFGRTGEYEVEAPDVFFVPSRQARRFPPSWEPFIESEGRYARVTWPEKIRPGGSLMGRLYHFDREVFGPKGITPLEADVDPVQRWLLEHPKVTLASELDLLFYDLETEMVEDWERPWRSRILSVSWASSRGRKGHIRVKARTDAAERDLLTVFFRLLDRHDAALAWGGSRFDDRVIRGRAAELGLEVEPDLTHWLDHLKLFKRYFLRTEDGAVLSSFALESVSAYLLGTERKVPIRKIARERGFKGGDIFVWLWENEPELLKEYNDQDVHLMRLLEEKTQFISLHLSLCRLCRILPNSRSIFPMRLVDGRMLQLGQERTFRFPTMMKRDDDEQRGKAKGAFVPEADIGLHESVAVLDFSKMYPSIIRTFNLSPETVDDEGDVAIPETDAQGQRTGRVLARFDSRKEGNLPAALRTILQERKQYSQRQELAEPGTPDWYDAQRLSTACKVMANTFYGVILSPFSRYYVQEVGESVTSIGRLLLASTMGAAQELGHRIVFGDTDSVAISATDEQAEALKAKVNSEVIPVIVQDAGADLAKSEIEIDYEKRFERILITASKRYAGRFAIYKGKPADPNAPFDVRGLEIVRSDVTIQSRELQKDLLEDILRGKGADELWTKVEAYRAGFIEGDTSVERLIRQQTVTKNLDEYEGSDTLHLKVAKQMVARGMEVSPGSKIPFLVTRAGPIIPEDLGSLEELDLHFYWNQYVFPPSLRVLESAFPEKRWAALLYSRGHDPNQLDLLSVPVEQENRTRPMLVDLGELPVVFRVKEGIDARRLKYLFEAFPGDHPVRVDMKVSDINKVAEIACPQRVVLPSENPKFAHALKILGARWEVR